MAGDHSSVERGIARAALFIAFMGVAAPSFAQSQGRVVRDGAIIWRADASLVAATLSVGTVVEVTAQSDGWFEVVIPVELGGRGERGLVARGQIELLPGTPEPPVRPLRGNATRAVSSPPPALAGPARQAARPPLPEPTIAIRGFGHAAYGVLSARKSFEAVLGRAHGPSFGAGAQIRMANGVFAQASWERFRRTGQRVFVFEETVFPLGIRNTISITPIAISGGYRFVRRSNAVPYVGGGVARYRLEETSPFSDEQEEVDQRFTGYQVIGGVEFRLSRLLAVAPEGQYASVPDALGIGGVSELFGERNLGGFQVRIKLLVGR